MQPLPFLPSAIKLFNDTYKFTSSIDKLDLISFHSQIKQFVIVQNGTERITISWPGLTEVDNLLILSNYLDKNWYIYKETNMLWAINLVALNSFFTDDSSPTHETTYFLRENKTYRCPMHETVLSELADAYAYFQAAPKIESRKSPQLVKIQLAQSTIWTVASKIYQPPAPHTNIPPSAPTAASPKTLLVQTWRYREPATNSRKRNKTSAQTLPNAPELVPPLQPATSTAPKNTPPALQTLANAAAAQNLTPVKRHLAAMQSQAPS